MKSIDKSARIALQAVDDLLEAQGVPVAELTPLPSDPYEFLTCCCYMVQRMSDNDKIVTRYVDDKEFESAAFSVLSKAIYEAIPPSTQDEPSH